MLLTSSYSRARFGAFELNLKARELRNGGQTVLLQEQPFKILVLLLERGTEGATREEIKRALWPSDTTVDFEHGINAAVKNLRRVLGDSPDNPKYIETLPRLGYRLLVPAEWVQASPRETASLPKWVAENADSPRPASEQETQGEPQLRLSRPAPGQRRLWTIMLVTLCLAVAALVIVTRYSRPGHTTRLAQEDIIVVGDFANSTGDPVFDDTLKTALSIALKQSPFLNVLPDNRVAATLELMTRPATTVLTPGVTSEICQRAGGKAYIGGSIVALGASYVVTLKAANCRSGDLLGQVQATAASKEDVLNALGKAASQLRGQLGESLATLKEFDVPLERATTSSLDALREYSLAHKSGETPTALSHLQHAVQLDPNFAMAYLAMGWYYFGLTEMGEADPYFTKAFDLREHASKLEKLKIAADYYMNVTGELDKAAQAYDELAASYPRSPDAYVMNITYAAQGQYEKALATYRRPLDLELVLGKANLYDNIGLALLALQRPDEARRAMHDAQESGFDDFLVHTELYALAFLAGDPKGMAAQQQWYAGKPAYENFGLALASDTELYEGRLRRAENLSRQAARAALRDDNKETAGTWRLNTALGTAAVGNSPEAQRIAAEALELAPTGPGVEAEAALAFAMSGNTTQAEALAEKINLRFPRDTQMQSLWLPAIRAQIALDHKNAVAALDYLQNTGPPLEFGQIMFINNISCLYPTYIHGQAFLAAQQGEAAAAEFQKILDHSGIVWNCWTGALAHLGLAQANSLQARNSQGADADAARARALAAFRDFLELWKAADSDIPIYKQAKTEYAQLKQSARSTQ